MTLDLSATELIPLDGGVALCALHARAFNERDPGIIMSRVYG